MQPEAEAVTNRYPILMVTTNDKARIVEGDPFAADAEIPLLPWESLIMIYPQGYYDYSWEWPC